MERSCPTYAQTLNAGGLSAGSRATPSALLWRVTTLRHHQARRTTVRRGEVPSGFGLAERAECLDRAFNDSGFGGRQHLTCGEPRARQQVPAASTLQRTEG